MPTSSRWCCLSTPPRANRRSSPRMKIAGIRAAIHVRTRNTKAGVETTVAIDHLIPAAASERQARWRISTRPARIPASEFDNAAAVNRRSGEGRAIRCEDLATGTTVAAVAYHLDDNAALPVLLTAVATRTDPAWVEISQGCVAILTAYLHELGSKLGRPDQVGYFAPTALIAETYTRLYGFRRAPVPFAWKTSGRYYLERPPFDD
jgi:hypothetical protein